MPVRPLPKALVERLRRIVKRDEEKAIKGERRTRKQQILNRMKNLDHRTLLHGLRGGNVFRYKGHVRDWI